jgi:hypothetical protein
MMCQPAAEPAAIALGVGNVGATARSYARLGLRVTRQGKQQATVELPCGIHLIVYSTERRRAVLRQAVGCAL